MTSATQQHLKGHYPMEDIIHEAKRLLGNIGIVLKFQPFVHNAQSVFHKKWQAMSHDGDARLFKPAVRGTGGEEAQSRRAGMWLMHANRVCPASNETIRHSWSKGMTGYGWMRQNTATWQIQTVIWGVESCNYRYISLHKQFTLWGMPGGSSSGGETEVCCGKCPCKGSPWFLTGHELTVCRSNCRVLD